MPCYLFTYHGHATWMPDRTRGYVHRQRGLQPSDSNMAENYRRNQREPAVHFTAPMQQRLIDTGRGVGQFIDARVHAVTAERTHVHVLIDWQHDRAWKSMRSSVRRAFTEAMKEQFGNRKWFSDSPSRKCVRDREHFQYLLNEYLPKHSGAKWFRTRVA